MKYLIIFFFTLMHLSSQGQSWNTPTIISSSQIGDRAVKRAAFEDSLNQLKFNRHLQMAGQGSAKDINAVGMCYFLGLGVAVDETTALKWFQQAAEKGYARAFYNLGLMHKYGKGTAVNFEKAYNYFSKAAAGNDPSGWYAQGYMLYKGLGCKQDYNQAYLLFRKGAAAARPSCMYFTGLCLRNGYGVERNLDSARYWLMRAARHKYVFAKDELAAKDPENNNTADEILQRIKELKIGNAPQDIVLNKYQKIPTGIPSNEIEGIFTGYALKYDWSGKYIVQASPLNVTINYNADSNKLTGMWTENERNTILLDALLTKNAIVFSSMQYDQTDHYNPVVPKRHTFETASLQYLKKGDTVYLLGNIKQYLPESTEPEKPIYIVLTKPVDVKGNDSGKKIFFADTKNTVERLQVYPNPVDNYFMVDFNLKEASQVQIQIFNPQGKMVYVNRAGKLDAGSYRLPVNTFLVAGTYIVKLQFGNKSESVTIVKL